MDWHRRYRQQAQWTRELRTYLFAQAGLSQASRIHAAAVRRASLVLEVGCGTGAVLSQVPAHVSTHGLDIDYAALAQCRVHAPAASLVRGNALELPYTNKFFDIVYCHFLLLWVRDPLQALIEMKRVAKEGAHILAFAEPDYTARLDEPRELGPLGEWQAESLRRQGADPGLGGRLADLFFQAGIRIVETGTLKKSGDDRFPEDWELEWEVIESDLAGFVTSQDLEQMKSLDRQARLRGERVLHVPTYFAWGRA
jgi:SAM-dependent methyltransferase